MRQWVRWIDEAQGLDYPRGEVKRTKVGERVNIQSKRSETSLWILSRLFFFMLCSFRSNLLLWKRHRGTPLLLSQSFAKARNVILKNEAIPFPEIRLVTFDAEGKSNSQIMARSEAIKMAIKEKLDLILSMLQIACLSLSHHCLFVSLCL
jgi:hypothetical protein